MREEYSQREAELIRSAIEESRREFNARQQVSGILTDAVQQDRLELDGDRRLAQLRAQVEAEEKRQRRKQGKHHVFNHLQKGKAKLHQISEESSIGHLKVIDDGFSLTGGLEAAQTKSQTPMGMHGTYPDLQQPYPGTSTKPRLGLASSRHNASATTHAMHSNFLQSSVSTRMSI